MLSTTQQLHFVVFGCVLTDKSIDLCIHTQMENHAAISASFPGSFLSSEEIGDPRYIIESGYPDFANYNFVLV